MSNNINSCAEKYNVPSIISYFWETWSQRSAEDRGKVQLCHPAWASTHPWGDPLTCVSVWRTIPSPHSQGFSLGRCGCAVLSGYLPSCAGLTFITLRCGSCSTFYKYLKIHCMGELKLGLPPSDARSRNGCFELDPLVCSHWFLWRMIFSFPLVHTGGTWVIVSLNALCCNFGFEIRTF